MDLLNAFEFTWDVYAAFFVLMGIIIIIIGLLVWGVNRVLTKLRHPPKFRFWSLLVIVSPAPAYGALLASVPFWLAFTFCWVWFYTLQSPHPDTSPNSLNFETWYPQYGTAMQFQGPLDAGTIGVAKANRFGACLIFFGFLGLLELGRMMIPNTLDHRYEDDVTKEGEAFDQVGRGTERRCHTAGRGGVVL